MPIRDESAAENVAEGIGRYAAASRMPRRRRRMSSALLAKLETTRPPSMRRHSTRRKTTSESEPLEAARARMVLVRSWRASVVFWPCASQSTRRST
jgi:hypothetical protein